MAEGAGFDHVVDDLRQQLATYRSLDVAKRASFSFAITRDEARIAIDEFHRTSCAAEALLDACVGDLFSKNLERILVTIGGCPTLEKHLPYRAHIRRSHVIGTHIPEVAYRDLLATPDARLSDAFSPVCAYCPSADGRPVEHAAILSYLRHVPEELLEFRIRLDDHDGNIQGMQYGIARAHAQGYTSTHPRVQGLSTLIESEQIAKEQTQRVFSDVAASVDLPFVQVKTRVKGGGRLAQKIVRMALNTSGSDAIKDPYGIQCVVRADQLEETKRFARRIEDALRGRDSRSIESPLHYGESARGDWKGYKMHAQYSDGQISIPVAFQFLPLSAYWRERTDHPYYEERQMRSLEELRSTGVPVDAMMSAVEGDLARAAQEWRELHSSSA